MHTLAVINRASLINIGKIFSYVAAFILIFWLLFNGLPEGYEYAVFMPAAYLFCILCVLKKDEVSISQPFIMVLLVAGAFRYVIQPLLISYEGGYTGRSLVEPDLDSYRLATILSVYELFVVSLFIYFYQNKNKHKPKNDINISTPPVIFSFGALVIAIGMLFFNPDALSYISFVMPNPLTKFQAVEPSFITKLSAYTFIISKQIFAITLLVHFYKKYNKNKKLRYKIIASFVCIVSVFIYFGVSRIDFLVSALSTYAIYRIFFGKVGFAKIALGVLVLLMMFNLITEKREYVEVERTNSERLLEYSQAYTGGIYNVAIGVEVKEWFPEASSFKVLAFDFLRPVIGLNLLVKNLDIKYSNIYFNDRVWTHVDRRSQIMPMIAQSNLYFGAIFAPVLTVLFVWIGLKINDYAGSTGNVCMKYFAIFCAFRFGLVFGQNSMNLLNELSFSLIMPALIIVAFSFFQKASKPR